MIEVLITFGKLDDTIKGQHLAEIGVSEDEQVLMLRLAPAKHLLHLVAILDRCKGVILMEGYFGHSQPLFCIADRGDTEAVKLGCISCGIGTG